MTTKTPPSATEIPTEQYRDNPPEVVRVEWGGDPCVEVWAWDEEGCVTQHHKDESDDAPAYFAYTLAAYRRQPDDTARLYWSRVRGYVKEKPFTLEKFRAAAKEFRERAADVERGVQGIVSERELADAAAYMAKSGLSPSASTPPPIKAFLRALHNGGRIVSTGDLDEREIVNARATGRMLVLDDGIGFVRFSSPDAFQGYADDCRASEAEAREAERRAKVRAEKAEALLREISSQTTAYQYAECWGEGDDEWVCECVPCQIRAHLEGQRK